MLTDGTVLTAQFCKGMSDRLGPEDPVEMWVELRVGKDATTKRYLTACHGSPEQAESAGPEGFYLGMYLHLQLGEQLGAIRFAAATTAMSELFAESKSIRRVMVTLAEEIGAYLVVFDREDLQTEVWRGEQDPKAIEPSQCELWSACDGRIREQLLRWYG